LSNCPPVASCQQSLCGLGMDCAVVSFDDRCPPSNITCFAPVCNNNGCGFKDTCTPTSNGCEGCSECSCLTTVNRCVKTCPSKRSVDVGAETDGGYMISYSLLFLILCLIFNSL
jgi:hypothetical protein